MSLTNDKIVHPFIGLLVNNMQTIQILGDQGNYYAGFRVMRSTLLLLKPESQKKAAELLAQINKCISFIDRGGKHQTSRALNWHDHYAKRRNTIARLSSKYFDAARQLTVLVWEGKYLTTDAYIGIVSAQTLPKKDPSPPKDPSPERLPEDLQ